MEGEQKEVRKGSCLRATTRLLSYSSSRRVGSCREVFELAVAVVVMLDPGAGIGLGSHFGRRRRRRMAEVPLSHLGNASFIR